MTARVSVSLRTVEDGVAAVLLFDALAEHTLARQMFQSAHHGRLESLPGSLPAVDCQLPQTNGRMR